MAPTGLQERRQAKAVRERDRRRRLKEDAIKYNSYLEKERARKRLALAQGKICTPKRKDLSPADLERVRAGTRQRVRLSRSRRKR